MNSVYCRDCGKEISANALACPHCGAQQNTNLNSPKSRMVAILLALFLGWFGVHKFYLGQATHGIIMLVLFIFGIGIIINTVWSIIDIITYATKTDEQFSSSYQ